ncbi:MAG: hypothetical protein K0U98_11805 [Deltaproteobacteria bacterium]|nr:hypothetical protein [Deltaproteobacteria bacterium]
MGSLRTLTLSVGLLGLALTTTVLAIGPTEMDDFQDGTTAGWMLPSATGNPTNIPDGGPEGTGDRYLQVISTGTGGPGSRVGVVNEDQWTGDYTAVGSEITITVDLANFGPPNPVDSGTGPDQLNIRVAFEGGEIPMLTGPMEGARWVSTTAFSLPEDGVWRTATFVLSEADMTRVEGTGAFTDVISMVSQFRIVSAATPSWRGDAIAANLGIDNIQVVSVPVELQTFSID